MPDPTLLGVVVVHFGAQEPTLACLRSVLEDPSSAGRRVLVVDNSANLDPLSLPAEVVRLPAADNPGFGAAANRGVAHLTARESAGGPGGAGGWVILNADVELLPGFLDAAAAALAGEPGGLEVGAAAGPLFLDHPSGPLWYAGGEVHRLLGVVTQSRSAADAARAREVSFLPGTALAVSRLAWQRVGGFDPAFFLYNEDLDLCLRLARQGFSLRFEPAMRAVHHLGAATGSGERSALYLEHLTRTRLLPFPSRPLRLWLALLHSGWVGLRVLAFLFSGHPGAGARIRALLRGHRDALASAWRGKGPAAFRAGG